jgi:ComF family protein
MFSVSKLNIVKAISQRNCLLCGVSSQDDLCNPCRRQLPEIPINHCPICLLPVTIPHICGACLTNPPAYTRILAAFHYTFPVDVLIHSLKYRSNLAIAPILAKLLIETINISDPPDFIIPMPLHPVRLRERGFNQAVEIGRYISQKHKINMLLDSCIRVRNTPLQTGLPWQQRKKNIRNAFSCNRDLSGKHVIILDDVMTSGATINELAQVLRQQGAATINGWVIARALPALDLHFS